MKRRKLKKIIVGMLAAAMTFSICGCGTSNEKSDVSNAVQGNKGKSKVTFADNGSSTMRLVNCITTYVLEKGYGYETETVNGSVEMTFQAVKAGDIDVYSEIWTEYYEPYEKAHKKGEVIRLGNVCGPRAGIYVPTYVIKGDSERGIEPMAPDLKSLYDLPKYWELFKDPEDPNKGQILSGPAGWAASEIIPYKMESYELDKNYNLITPGSDAAIMASIASAYEKGKPWVGYYYTPTWAFTKYDMTLLEDNPYDREVYNKESKYKCEFPKADSIIVANKNLPEEAPLAADFLKKFNTNDEIIAEALLYIKEIGASEEEAAIKFLKENKDMWSKWVTEEAAQKVKDSLK